MGGLSLLALDGMYLPWHWSCKAYGGIRGLLELESKIAAALGNVVERTGCRVVWTRPMHFSSLSPIFRTPSSLSSHGTVAADTLAILAESAAEASVTEGGCVGKTPTLACTLSRSSVPGSLSVELFRAVLYGADSPHYSSPIGSLVTRRILLTRLRPPLGTQLEHQPQGLSSCSIPIFTAPSASVFVSTNLVAADGVMEAKHPGDPSNFPWGLGAGEGDKPLPQLPNGPQQLKQSNSPVVSVALVAAREDIGDGKGVRETILALAA